MDEKHKTDQSGNDTVSAFLRARPASGEDSATLCDRLERTFGADVFADAIEFLTHMRLKASEARADWREILEHRESMSRQTGRDMGLFTTVVDYYTSVRPRLHTPVTLEADDLAQCQRLMIIDDLTGLFNRRFFGPELRKELERSRRLSHPMVLIMGDLDHFKRFNDTYGHAAGDRALARAGRVLRGCARLMDQAVRYGGEEFALILPHTTKADGMVVAERVRAAMAAEPVTHPDGTPLTQITMSIGLASFPEDADGPETLIEAADRALYRAKGQGRNQVCDLSDELRRDKRRTLRLNAELLLMGDKNTPIAGRVLDISSWGVRCKTPTAIEPGCSLTMVLHDGDSGLSLSVPTVRSVWSEASRDGSWRTGLSFPALKGHARDHLEDYLNRHGDQA